MLMILYPTFVGLKNIEFFIFYSTSLLLCSFMLSGYDNNYHLNDYVMFMLSREGISVQSLPDIY